MSTSSPQKRSAPWIARSFFPNSQTTSPDRAAFTAVISAVVAPSAHVRRSSTWHRIAKVGLATSLRMSLRYAADVVAVYLRRLHSGRDHHAIERERGRDDTPWRRSAASDRAGDG